MKKTHFFNGEIMCPTPEDTFDLGEKIGEALRGGEILLLTGTLGAGKTIMTKGIVNALGYDIDEVTSPSFTLVNLYQTSDFDLYHIDLWRLGKYENARFAVGLDDILEDPSAIVIIEWADRLGADYFERETWQIQITGDGEDPRLVTVIRSSDRVEVKNAGQGGNRVE